MSYPATEDRNICICVSISLLRVTGLFENTIIYPGDTQSWLTDNGGLRVEDRSTPSSITSLWALSDRRFFCAHNEECSWSAGFNLLTQEKECMRRNLQMQKYVKANKLCKKAFEHFFCVFIYRKMYKSPGRRALSFLLKAKQIAPVEISRSLSKAKWQTGCKRAPTSRRFWLSGHNLSSRQFKNTAHFSVSWWLNVNQL